MYDPAVMAPADFVDAKDWSKRQESRRAAEIELDRRDMEREKNKNQRIRSAGYDEEDEKELQRDRFGDYDPDREYDYGEAESDEDDGKEEAALNIEAFDVSLREWIAQERTRREIQRRFKEFLLTYHHGYGANKDANVESNADDAVISKDLSGPKAASRRKNSPIYPAKIRYLNLPLYMFFGSLALIIMLFFRVMCAANGASLEVSYTHLCDMPAILAIWLADVPKEMLQIFDEVLSQVVHKQFPHYKKVMQY